MAPISLIKSASPPELIGTVNQLVNAVNVLSSQQLPTPAPTGGANYWNSSLLQHARVDNSPGQKFPILGAYEEPSAWQYPPGTHNLIVAIGGYQYYAYAVGDPTVAANWSSPTLVLGNGTGGEASTAEHSWCFTPDGVTLYLYYINSTQDIWYATAPIATPTVFTRKVKLLDHTAFGGNGATGNVAVLLIGGVYYMFIEYGVTTYSYNLAIYSCSTPGGTFTSLLNPVASARPTFTYANVLHVNQGSVSGPWVGLDYDGATVVLLYHACPYGGLGVPTDIYRATIPLAGLVAGTDGWTVTNNAFPILSRTGNVEIQQVADPFIYNPGGGTNYLFYEGDNNFGTSGSQLFITPLLTMQKASNVYGWANDDVTTDYVQPLWGVGANYQNSCIAAEMPLGAYVAPNPVGTWALDTTTAGMVYNCRSYNSSAAQNDSIQWDVYLLPGQYRIDGLFGYGPDHGIITLTMSTGFTTSTGQSWGTLDLYAAAASFNNAAHISSLQVNLNAPVHARMVWKMATKNASSSGYICEWHSWTLTKYN